MKDDSVDDSLKLFGSVPAFGAVPNASRASVDRRVISTPGLAHIVENSSVRPP